MENCELSINMFNKLANIFPEFKEWTTQDVVERFFLTPNDVG